MLTQPEPKGTMPLITSVAGISKAREICRLAKVNRRLIMGDKLVTQAIKKMNPPVTVLIVATDSGCADLVSKATEHKLPILKMSTRSEVGDIVGYPSVSSCVLSFEDDEELLSELLKLG